MTGSGCGGTTRKTGRDGMPQRGSVSVFLAAATAGFVLLGALLIDFARIAAFRHASQLAVQSGVRSVLAAYDPVFYERYGLFIRGGDAGDELFQAALAQHAAGGKPGIFPYLQAEWQSAGVIESRPLADHEVFRRQVLEEMKYKAPVDLALELAEKFRGISPALAEAAATADLLDRMREAFERREAELDRVLEIQTAWGQSVTKAFRELAAELQQADGQYGGYLAQRQALAHLGPEADPLAVRALVMAIFAYENRVRQLAARGSDASRSALETTAAMAAEARSALQRAEAINGEMRAMAQEADIGTDSLAHLELNIPGQNGEDMLASLKELRASARQLVLDEAFFADWRRELDLQEERSRALAQEAGRVAGMFASLDAGDESTLRQAAAGLREMADRYGAAYGAGGSVIAARRELLQRHREHEEERRALEKEAREEWAGWGRLMAIMRNAQGSQEDRAAFENLRRLAGDNLAWNKEQEAFEEPRDWNDPLAGRAWAREQTGRLLGGLEDALVGKRDDLYFAEYAHARFSRFAPADVKKLLDGEAVGLAPDRQEAEYILYGLAHPAGNLAAAYGEIFAFRLAVRTLEGFIESRNAVHPLVVLAAAVLYGIKHAVQDIYDLLAEDNVPLSRYLHVPTSYADYLRLFYLLRGGHPGQMSRFLAVMEHRTGLDMTRAYTYVSGEGIASLRLWFFPGLLKALGRTGHLGGTVEGNRYVAEFRADSAYQ